MNRCFWYRDGIPTFGLWVPMDGITSFEDLRSELVDRDFISESYDGDLLVADAEGLCKCCAGQYGTFDFSTWEEMESSSMPEEVIEAYYECFGDYNDRKCQEKYYGKFDGYSDLAIEILESAGEIESIPKHLRNYFDYDAYAQDLELSGDFAESNGYFFFTC